MAEEKSRLLVYKVFGQTLDASARVLFDAATGRLSVKSTDRRIAVWTQQLFDTGKITLDIRGAGRVTAGQPYVLMSNHASLLDVPCVFRAFPGSVRMVAKSELARVPLFGPAMRKAGTVIIDRGDRQKAIQQLAAARELLDQGVSLWIAPEGTRSKDGRLGEFKKGGFHVAVDLQIPILPIFIEGTRNVLETKSLVGRPGQRVSLEFGTPIPTAGTTAEDIPRLMREVRVAMLRMARAVGAVAGEEADPA